MDYRAAVDKILARYDVSRETDRRKAYTECEQYAHEHIQGRREFNAFMDIAAEKLDMPPTYRNSVVDWVGDVPENARVHLRYAKNVGPELTANADGLRYLAALLTELARQQIEDDHIHLYSDSAPMCGKTFPLTIYHEPDSWFDRLAGQDEEEDEGEPAIVERDVDPSAVAALCVLSEVPPEMQVTRYRPYRVLAVQPHEEQEVWEKPIREGRERFFLFTIVNDIGDRETFGFDLDDPEILFISRADLGDEDGKKGGRSAA